jgi:thioredoxin-related protein
VGNDDAALKDKHVFIDFYMEGCYWCFKFQSEWNQIVDDMTLMYGDQNVAFLKVDGQNIYQVSNKYGVESYPTFVYVKPNTKGLKAVMFRGDRTYAGMMSWMKR